MIERRECSPIPPKEVLDAKSLIITLDGSRIAGKKVVAEKLAKRYNLTIFNTGTTIRALALLAIENKMVRTDDTNVTTIPVDFAEKISEFYDTMPQKFRVEKPTEGSRMARIMVGDRDMQQELQTYPKPKAIDNLASMIAASPGIRWKLYQSWRETVKNLGGTIVIGRKTGLDLFPDAKIKLYLYASPEASAIYRFAHEPNARPDMTSEQLYIRERDGMDTNNGLLDRPARALALDTSNYIKDMNGLTTLEDRIATYINARFEIR